MDMIKMLAAALLVCFALFGGVFVVSSVTIRDAKAAGYFGILAGGFMGVVGFLVTILMW